MSKVLSVGVSQEQQRAWTKVLSKWHQNGKKKKHFTPETLCFWSSYLPFWFFSKNSFSQGHGGPSRVSGYFHVIFFFSIITKAKNFHLKRVEKTKIDSDLENYAKTKYFILNYIWGLAQLVENLKLKWTGCKLLISFSDLLLHPVAFIPYLPYPVTEIVTIYTVLSNFENFLNQLKQDSLPFLWWKSLLYFGRDYFTDV